MSTDSKGEATPETIAWTPVNTGSGNFHSHDLVSPGDGRMAFQPSRRFRIWSLLMLGIGPLLIWAGVALLRTALREGDDDLVTPVVLIVAGITLPVIGAFLRGPGAIPIVFDKRLGHCWKDKRSPETTARRESLGSWTPLNRIAAVQWLRWTLQGRHGTHLIHELNLVLRDGSRINLVDHRSESAMGDEAGRLAGFLGVPVWECPPNEDR